MYEVENKIICVYGDHRTFYTLDEAFDWPYILRDIFRERFQHEISKKEDDVACGS